MALARKIQETPTATYEGHYYGCLKEQAALLETGLPESTYPADCHYTFDEMMSRDTPWPPQD